MQPLLIPILIAIISAIAGYVIRKLTESVSESSVRQIVGDKIDPIKEDISEIKCQINRLFNLFLKHPHDRAN